MNGLTGDHTRSPSRRPSWRRTSLIAFGGPGRSSMQMNLTWTHPPQVVLRNIERRGDARNRLPLKRDVMLLGEVRHIS